MSPESVLVEANPDKGVDFDLLTAEVAVGGEAHHLCAAQLAAQKLPQP